MQSEREREREREREYVCVCVCGEDSVCSVSYTHLDVYKRQDMK